METTARPTNRIIGTTDEGGACDCCGRTNLKTYVVIAHEDGSIARYGTSCASVMLKVDTAEVRQAAKAADDAARVAEIAAQEEHLAAVEARFHAWVLETYGLAITQTADLHGKVAEMTPFQVRKAWQASLCTDRYKIEK